MTAEVLGRRVEDGGNTLTHGTQEDTFSCGICTVNAVDHALFNVELFIPRQRRVWRAYYFNKLVRAQNERVSIILELGTTSTYLRTQIQHEQPAKLQVPATVRPDGAGESGSLAANASLAGPSRSNAMSVDFLLAADEPAGTATQCKSVDNARADPAALVADAQRSSSAMPLTAILEDPPVDESRLDPFVDPFTMMDVDLDDIPCDIPEVPSSAPSSVPPSPASSLQSLPSSRVSEGLPVGAVSEDEPSVKGMVGERRDRGAESDCSDGPATKKLRTVYGVVGISASAQASRKLKKAMENDTLVKNEKRLESYRDTCLVYDRGAKFEYGAKWRVWHSVCGQWYKQKEAYSTTRFTAHVVDCNQKRVDRALAKQKQAGKAKVRRADVTVSRHGSLDGWFQKSKTAVKVVTSEGRWSRLSSACQHALIESHCAHRREVGRSSRKVKARPNKHYPVRCWYRVC